MLDFIFMVIKNLEAINWQKISVSDYQRFLSKKHNILSARYTYAINAIVQIKI